MENKEDIQIEDIGYLSDQEQCEFARVLNEYSPLHTEGIEVSEFNYEDIPQFRPSQVWQKLATMSTNKSSTKDDVPAKILKILLHIMQSL